LQSFDQILHWQFLANAFSITVVDVILRGDNAVVIAAAARSLPSAQRRRALVAGAACAIVALVVAAFFATRILQIKFIQLIGGVAILWISLGLFREEAPQQSAQEVSGFWKAMWLIVVADITMSLDNVLAIAAIAQGDVYLLIFGLGLSIPMVVVASAWIAKLMDNYPVIIYIGAALLGRVAGQMIMTDRFTVQTLAPTAALKYSTEAAGVILVLAAGFWMKRRRRQHTDHD
jgi:YjbE family integral membrane protein